MKVRVRVEFLGYLADTAGYDSLDCLVEDSPDKALAEIRRIAGFSGEGGTPGNYVVLVNGKILDSSFVGQSKFCEGDRITFIPIVSGG